MTCCQCQGAESVFSGWYVSRELRSYRRKGPRRTTRMLIDALEAEDVEGATLLDIGGGVGAIQHELLRQGLSSATAADAASAYLEAASREAERQGHADRVQYRHGDFVQLADEFERADVVTLDRVICCYHDMRSLVERSVGKAVRLYGLVYPRDVWWTRLGNRLLNLFLWLTRNPFRVFVHSEAVVDGIVRTAGFELRYRRLTPSWQVVLYERSA
jgi:hypothetical protein